MLHAGSAGMVPHHAAGYMEQEVTSSLGCSGFPSKRHKLLRTELAGLGFFLNDADLGPLFVNKSRPLPVIL